jgi:UDP-N-acetylglucosamine--N-acetylmuramyl-(pentapeptide) pyrophosphoryl-undecaprenol N-acetylglucosamine transferase
MYRRKTINSCAFSKCCRRPPNKNANALVAKNAAILITDSEAPDLLFKIALDLLKQKEKCALFSFEIKKIQKLNATADIVDAFENSLIENGTK